MQVYLRRVQTLHCRAGIPEEGAATAELPVEEVQGEQGQDIVPARPIALMAIWYLKNFVDK